MSHYYKCKACGRITTNGFDGQKHLDRSGDACAGVYERINASAERVVDKIADVFAEETADPNVLGVDSTRLYVLFRNPDDGLFYVRQRNRELVSVVLTMDYWQTDGEVRTVDARDRALVFQGFPKQAVTLARSSRLGHRA